jgi:D-alanyl-D-alanine carboxypeptidase
MRIAAPLALLVALLACSSAARAESLPLRDAVGYRHGKRRTIQVVTLGWTDVEVRTARAFLAMAAAAAEDGIELWIRSGFRSQEEQRMFYQAYRAGWGNRAARPGHSNHQSGTALDLYLGDGTFEWLEANGRRFGFKRTVAGEPWHWEYTKPPPRAKRRARRRIADRD